MEDRLEIYRRLEQIKLDRANLPDRIVVRTPQELQAEEALLQDKLKESKNETDIS